VQELRFSQQCCWTFKPSGNVTKYTSYDTASHPRRHESSKIWCPK